MGLAPLNLRQAPPLPPPAEDSEVDLSDMQVDPSTADMALGVELPDGGILITLGGQLTPPSSPDTDHDANLAEHLDEGTLNMIADDLIRLIEDDDVRQSERLEDIATGMDLLGIKLETPRSEPTEEGMSNIRHPLILEAVMRFQANCRGEFLPADGPVKVRDDGGSTEDEDDEANKLARDMNHYLTSTALEYYPDTDRMHFSLGFGGEAYKKVYNCPIRRRPVSETVDRKDIILAEGAVSIEACKRVTHRIPNMAASDIRRMQIVGAYRDVDLGPASFTDIKVTDEKMADISGVAPKRMLEDDNDRTIFECYCELDLPGYEHDKGLKLPYRVTIEKDSRKILEIRRWWTEGDENYLRNPVFVEYLFVPAFPGVNLGLLQILGNADRALTAAWRIALDNGMYSNFPGGLMARSAGKQRTTNIRIAPGQVQEIDAENGDITKAFMPLPYRDVTPGFMQIVEMIQGSSERLAGTAETETGEGRQNTPVGTTLAMIEQATMVLNAVHKRMHAAQLREFQMLKNLFAQDPEALWRQNAKARLPQDAQTVVNALNNNDIVPASDPNTSSQSLRIQKALLIQQRADARPDLYDPMAVERRVFREIGITDVEDLFRKEPLPPQGQQQDPAKMIAAQASMLSAQAKMADTQSKAAVTDRDSQTKAMDTQVKAFSTQQQAQDKAADRDAQMKIEALRVEKEKIIHSDTQAQDFRMHQNELGLEHARLAHEAQLAQLAAAGERSAGLSQMAFDHAQAQADRQHQVEQADAEREHQVAQAKADRDLQQAQMRQAAKAAKQKPKGGNNA